MRKPYSLSIALSLLMGAFGAYAFAEETFETPFILGTLNGLNRPDQELVIGTSGNDVNLVSEFDTHTLNVPDAAAAKRGVVTTGTQTFGGNKTFNGTVSFGSTTSFTGLATLGSLTVTGASNFNTGSFSGATTFTGLAGFGSATFSGTTGHTGLATFNAANFNDLVNASSLQINSTPTIAVFHRTCTLTSAAATTPVTCLPESVVPTGQKAYLTYWHAKVNGGTSWNLVNTCYLEDSAGTDVITFPGLQMAGNAFFTPGTGGLTYASSYTLSSGMPDGQGMQVSCASQGSGGSDFVVTVSGFIK